MERQKSESGDRPMQMIKKLQFLIPQGLNGREAEVTINQRFEILTMEPKPDCIALWVLVDLQSKMVVRRFTIIETGEPIPDYVPRIYVGSIGARGTSPRSFHVFLEPNL